MITKHKLAALSFIASSIVQSRYSVFNCEENRLLPFTDLQVDDYILSSEENTETVELMKCLKVTKLVNTIERNSKTGEAQDNWLFDLENGSSFSMDLNNLEERSNTCESSETGENLCGGMSGSSELSEKARKCSSHDYEPQCTKLYAQWPANQLSKSKKSCNRRKRQGCSRNSYTRPIRRQNHPRKRQYNQNRRPNYQKPRCDTNSPYFQKARENSRKNNYCDGTTCFTSKFIVNRQQCSWHTKTDSYPDPSARDDYDDYSDDYTGDYGFTGPNSGYSPCSGSSGSNKHDDNNYGSYGNPPSSSSGCHGKTNVFVNDDDYNTGYDDGGNGGGSMGSYVCKKKHAL